MKHLKPLFITGGCLAAAAGVFVYGVPYLQGPSFAFKKPAANHQAEVKAALDSGLFLTQESMEPLLGTTSTAVFELDAELERLILDHVFIEVISRGSPHDEYLKHESRIAEACNIFHSILAEQPEMVVGTNFQRGPFTGEPRMKPLTGAVKTLLYRSAMQYEEGSIENLENDLLTSVYIGREAADSLSRGGMMTWSVIDRSIMNMVARLLSENPRDPEIRRIIKNVFAQLGPAPRLDRALLYNAYRNYQAAIVMDQLSMDEIALLAHKHVEDCPPPPDHQLASDAMASTCAKVWMQCADYISSHEGDDMQNVGVELDRILKSNQDNGGDLTYTLRIASMPYEQLGRQISRNLALRKLLADTVDAIDPSDPTFDFPDRNHNIESLSLHFEVTPDSVEGAINGDSSKFASFSNGLSQDIDAGIYYKLDLS